MQVIEGDCCGATRENDTLKKDLCIKISRLKEVNIKKMLIDLDDHQFFKKKRGDYIPLYYITIRSLRLLINQFKTLLCPIQDHFL